MSPAFHLVIFHPSNHPFTLSPSFQLPIHLTLHFFTLPPIQTSVHPSSNPSFISLSSHHPSTHHFSNQPSSLHPAIHPSSYCPSSLPSIHSSLHPLNLSLTCSYEQRSHTLVYHDFNCVGKLDDKVGVCLTTPHILSDEQFMFIFLPDPHNDNYRS